MTKRRDAGTGQYISEEEAKSRPENTWVEEKGYGFPSSPRFQKYFKEVYDRLLAHAGYSECEDFESVKVVWITKVFKEAGLVIED